MSAPVNVIKFRFDPDGTLERHWHIEIDKNNLVDLIEQVVTKPVPRHWPSKTKALVNLNELKKSLTDPGLQEILICANCAAAGYRNCGDLDLEPFHVIQEADFIIWELKAPPLGIPSVNGSNLRFTFHRPQYATAVEEVLEKK
jgi:hypothetical protein